ncbi:hypothetical protein [Streptomyces sp. NPDC046862]|uniref:hypothetical protein n=1 Tax=Streptomyces sp. NPDC046862 TaxID=3154603 RepID=UPI00345737C8
MTRRRITRGAVGATAAVLALGALQGASAVGADRETEGVGSSSSATTTSKVCVGTQPEGRLPSWGPKGSYPDDTPLYRTLAYVDKRAKDRPGIFTGLAIDDENLALDVYRVPGHAQEKFDADICGTAEKGVTLRLYDTDVTERGLKRLVDRISGDMERWKGTFMIWSVGMDSHRVHVGVSDVAKAEPILRETYGEELMKHIVVEQEEQASID